jgi:tripartite-type tricarboxylate transporter receptor subunit TctC
MKGSRIWKLFFIGWVVFAGIVGETLGASTFPDRPITLYFGSTAGGGLHMYIRSFAEKMSEILGQPVVVVAKPGAGQTIAASFVAKSKPDGYTLLSVAGGNTSSGEYLTTKVSYKNTDFEYFGQYCISERFLYVMSHKPWKTLQELIDYSKKHPEKVMYPGQVVQRIPMETFCRAAGIKWVLIPKKGDTEFIQCMLTGDCDVALGWASSIWGMKDAQMTRILATFAEQRSRFFPEVPTFGELGYPQVVKTAALFYGLAGPKGIPKEASDKIGDAFARALQDKEVQQKMANLGVRVEYMPGLQLQKLVLEEEKRYRKLYKEFGVEILNE